MKRIKKNISLIITLFLVFVIFLTLYLVKQKQEIRKKGAAPDEALLFLEAEHDSPYPIDEDLEVYLKLNTQGNWIDTIQVFLGGLPVGTVINVNQETIEGLTWAAFDTSNPQEMKFLLHANGPVGTPTPGVTPAYYVFSNDTPQTLVTFTLPSPHSIGTKSLIFDQGYTKVLLAGDDITARPLEDGEYYFGTLPTSTPIPTNTPMPTNTPIPTSTPILTPTPTPGGQHPGCTGLDAPTTVTQGDTITLIAHPVAPLGTSLESVEFWYIPDEEALCPKSNWAFIGTDSNGSDGWSVSWNTDSVPDNRYFVAANVYLEGHEWWCTGNPDGPCNEDPQGTSCSDCSAYIEVITPTPTSTPTPTNTPTPTPTSAPTTLMLQLNFQGIGSIYGSKYYPNRKALVRGYLQGGKKFEEEIDCVWDDSQDYYVGSLGFSSFDNGDYQLFLEGWYNNVPLYLRIDAGFHNLISNRENIVNLTDSSLPVGNLKYDDIEPETIEGSDLSLLLGKIRDYDFGQLSQEVIEDFNADYYIDGTDLSLLLSNIFESNTALPGE